MKRNLEEQKIRQWFHEARHADELRAPSFAETLAAARASNQRGGRRFVWRAAFVTAALLAIGIAAFVFLMPSKTQPVNPIAVGPSVVPAPYSPRPPSGVDSPTPVAPAPTVKGRRASLTPRRPRVARPRGDVGRATLLSFKWRSPTDFLLRTPGADVLRTVPRLGESLVRFDIFASDEKN